MSAGRYEELKRLDIRSRNQLRHILSTGGNDAVNQLSRLRGRLGAQQSDALEKILRSSASINGAESSNYFPKGPPFSDRLIAGSDIGSDATLKRIEDALAANWSRIVRISEDFTEFDLQFGARNHEACISCLARCIEENGWSHALFRKMVALREMMPEVDQRIEDFMQLAGINRTGPVVSTLVHAFSRDQIYLTARRSVQNIADRGTLNRYTRNIARLATHPLSNNVSDLFNFLLEVEKCSLIDAVVLLKFNCDIIESQFEKHPTLLRSFDILGRDDDFSKILRAYDSIDEDSESSFYQQSSAWLEYKAVRGYRLFVDSYYDAGRDTPAQLTDSRKLQVSKWIGPQSLERMVRSVEITSHGIGALANLETAGRVTRSALFNYWLEGTEGTVGIERDELFSLMGLTRDLSRTVPVAATRTAARLASDQLVKLILLLLLAKRTKNEYDSYQLRKLLESITISNYQSSVVRLVEDYYRTHPYVSEYIYDIATEDFLAKLGKLAPHLSDIPDIRASLHEWMAKCSGDERYTERARTVRIDHQLNRVRNEIDDHRIYVDPSRFSSWIQDEMMIELSSALNSSGGGKRAVAVTGDETVLSMVMAQCYTAFCSNAVFGIASYIGRRIRHGTFHGHLYSSVINPIESSEKFRRLSRYAPFLTKWNQWKDLYDKKIKEVILEKLHVKSKAKPGGLIQPDAYSSHKQDVLAAAVGAIIAQYAESKTTEGLYKIITDYCWRLAEVDLNAINAYLMSQRQPMKFSALMDEFVLNAPADEQRLAAELRRDLVHAIDLKLKSICGWFKRPSNVSPRVSLSLLYDAVVREVQDSHPQFDPQTEASPNGDIQLEGGAYHIMYDSLAVIVSNAAKYGDASKPVSRVFAAVQEIQDKKTEKKLVVEISSVISSTDDPADVSRMIEQRKSANFDDANLYDRRSGISKLMQLASIRSDFSVEFLGVVGSEVKARFAYALEY